MRRTSRCACFIGCLFCACILWIQAVFATPPGMASSQFIVDDESLNIPTDTVRISRQDLPEEGEAYGELWSEKTGVLARVFWGDNEEILMEGAGTCMSGLVPGCGRPVILAGHVLSYFQKLQLLNPGDIICLDTWYGRYEYEVAQIGIYDQYDLQAVLDEKLGYEEEEGSRIFFLNHEDAQELDIEAGREELIVYTCFPFYARKEEKTERYAIFAWLVSGPHVVLTEEPPRFYTLRDK